MLLIFICYYNELVYNIFSLFMYFNRNVKINFYFVEFFYIIYVLRFVFFLCIKIIRIIYNNWIMFIKREIVISFLLEE